MRKLFALILILAGSAFAQEPNRKIQLALEQRDYETALIGLANLRRADKKTFVTRNYDYLLARILEKRGDFAKAAANYQAVVKRKSPLREYALWHLSQIARSSGNLLLERVFLRELQTFAPKSLLSDATHARLARSFFESKDFASTISLLQNSGAQTAPMAAVNSLKSDKTPGEQRRARENQVLLGRSFLLSGKSNAAREIFDNLIASIPNPSQPDDFALAAVRGLDELDIGSEKFGKVAPQISEAEHLKRAAIYQFNRDFKNARLHYHGVANILPRTANFGIATFQTGRGFAQDGNFQEAANTYESLLGTTPNDAFASDALLQLGSVYSRLGRSREAISTYEKFIERFQDSASIERAYLNIVDINRDKGDDIEALRWTEKTRERFKGKLPEAQAIFAQARICFSRSDWISAVFALNELNAFSDLGGTRVPGGTNKTEVAFLKAYALEQAGNFDEAFDAYLSIPDGRNEFYGSLSTERLKVLVNDSNKRNLFEQRIARMNTIAREALTSANAEQVRQAAQSLLRFSLDENVRRDLLNIVRSAYALIPDYQNIPRGAAQDFLNIANSSSQKSTPANSHRSLANTLLFLGLYDEGTPELEAAILESDPSANIFPANPPSDLKFTLAQFYKRGDIAHRAVGYLEPLWKNIPADFQIELIPRDQLEMLFPTPYADSLLKFAPERKLDPRFALAIMRQESRFRADVKSAAAARGLMQFISSTADQVAAELGRKDFNQDELYNPPTAILFGSQYLSNIFKQFPEKPAAVAAAYNGGEASTARWVARAKSNAVERYVPEIIFSQSKDYVYRVMANYRMYQYLYDENLKPR